MAFPLVILNTSNFIKHHKKYRKRVFDRWTNIFKIRTSTYIKLYTSVITSLPLDTILLDTHMYQSTSSNEFKNNFNKISDHRWLQEQLVPRNQKHPSEK